MSESYQNKLKKGRNIKKTEGKYMKQILLFLGMYYILLDSHLFNTTFSDFDSGILMLEDATRLVSIQNIFSR